jgi:hypothetical protein
MNEESCNNLTEAGSKKLAAFNYVLKHKKQRRPGGASLQRI